MRIKINYQINKNCIMKKIEMCSLLAKSKLIQHNRNYERKIYKQQVEELNKKLKSLEEKLKHE